MTEEEVMEFWNAHPCDDDSARRLFGGLGADYEEFFTRYDKFRYSKTKACHIPVCLDGIYFCGKRVLEIGLGQGADSEQIIRRGAIWSGIDLTPESVQRVRTRLKLRDLPYERIEQGSALRLPFAAESFDIVFSHGVLHHIPDIKGAQKEIARVLKPDGELIAMLYAKFSLQYLLHISVVARLGLIARYVAGRRDGEVGQHLPNAQKMGFIRYLRMKNFIHRSTDGALNPYSKVYHLAAVREDFPDFTITQHYRRYLSPHRRYMSPPLSWVPLDRALGWHLWVHMKRRVL